MPGYERLSAADLRRVNATCEQFEQSLTKGEDLRAEDWTADAEGTLREVLLEELLILECEHRLRNAATIDAAELNRRLPDRTVLLASSIQQAIRYASVRIPVTVKPDENGIVVLPTRIGRFVIRELLGIGGFGTVYRAFDPELHREVAVKVSHPYTSTDAKASLQFSTEAKRLAKLDHPNLVQVFDTGFTEGRPFLVTAFVNGPNLANWLREHRKQNRLVSFREVAELLRDLAEAVEYVHRQGILHCDIKPANILIEVESPLVPRLADFGLSRLRDGSAECSTSGKLIGTPQYMAPEQANEEWGEVAVTTDVYSLGAVLYELLTGRSPVAAGTLVDVIRRVVEGVPERPCRIRPDLPTDLEAVCWKCLEKQPHLRYQTARELADDLGCFLRGIPVQAALPSRGRRFAATIRQHRFLSALVVMSLLMIVSTIVGLVVHTAQLDRVNGDLVRAQTDLVREEKTRIEREAALRAEAYPDQIRVAGMALARWDRETARRVLDTIPANGNLRGFEWRHLQARTEPPPSKILASVDKPIFTIDVSPDRKWIAFGGADRTVRVIDAENGKRVAGPWVHPNEIAHLSFSPDGRRVAVACADCGVRIWDVASGQAQLVIVLPGRPHHVAFHPNGEWLAIGGDDPAVTVLDLTSAKRPSRTLHQSNRKVRAMDFSPTGDRLVFGTLDQGVHSWPYATQDHAELLPCKQFRINALRFTPSGNELVLGARSNGGVSIHSVRAATQTDTPIALSDGINITERINDFDWSRDGHRLAVARETGIDIWEWPTRIKRITLPVVGSRVYGIRFIHNDEQLVLVSDDGTVRVNRIADDTAIAQSAIDWLVTSIAFSTDGQSCEVANQHQSLALKMNPSTRPPTISSVSDSQYLSVGAATIQESQQGIVRFQRDQRHLVFNSTTTPDVRPELERLTELLPESSKWWCTAINTSGSLFGCANAETRTIGIWDARTGKLKQSFTDDGGEINALAIFGDTLFATGSRDGNICLRSIDGKSLKTMFVGHTRQVRNLAFTHDGRRLVSCSWDRTVRIWSVEDGTCMKVLGPHGGIVHAITISPDNQTVASGSNDGVIRLWHIASGQEMLSIPTEGPIRAIAFDPTGQRLAVASQMNLELVQTQFRILESPILHNGSR